MSTRQIFWVNLVLDVLVALGTVIAAAVLVDDSWSKVLTPVVLIPALLAAIRAVQSAVRNIKTDLEAPKELQPVDVSIFGSDPK